MNIAIKKLGQKNSPVPIWGTVPFFLVFLVLGNAVSFAQSDVVFGPRQAKIGGRIPYSVLGKYKAEFKDFRGRIVLDDQSSNIRSVYLEIKVNSITSNSSWCDKIVKSRRLLNTAQFPNIIFQSQRIIHDAEGFKVKGILEMHGIKKSMIFPFKEALPVIQGSWRINRKEFNIIWNKYLDHGGVIVGDYLTVDWSIRVYPKR